MPEHTDPSQRVGSMRVFISWSGERSKVLAQALKDWLPLVLHYVEPWMSQANIDAGERWAVAVAKELEASNFGIICVTRENVNSPWVLFEAGALAKSLQDSRVIPLLLDLDFKDITGPLAQFQAKKVEKTGISEVIQSLNQAASHIVPVARAEQLFEALWPKLEKITGEIPKPSTGSKPTRSSNDVMEELVSGVRALEVRVRELDDGPRPSKYRRFRFHPFMMKEVSHMLGDTPGDPIALLFLASFFREELPWLYEIALEAYRACRAGTQEAAADAMKRFRRAARALEEGPFISEEYGIDRKTIHMILREFERFSDDHFFPEYPPPKTERKKEIKPESV